jgi:soluble lytic murein transglycosylase-like protein
MWRESRCQPEVRSRTSDTGLLQINDVNRPWLSHRFGSDVTVETLKNADINVKASAELFKYWSRVTGNGYQPWRTR